MKQAENNEIVTLVRNLARRERTVQSGPDSSASRDFAAQGAHLDIDELSSYAERALPPSARARCTAHLADCDDCRKIVAQLSMAAGPLTEERKTEDGAFAGLTWVQKLSTLLSPRMIRYAMPVLVLVVVAIAFFAWRQQRTNDYVALNERSQPVPASKPVDNQPAATDRPGDNHSKAGEVPKSRDQKEANAQPTPAAPARAAGTTTGGQISEEKRLGDVAGGETTASKAGAAKASKADAPAADKAAAERDAYAPEPGKSSLKPQLPVPANQEHQKDLAKNSNADGLDRGRDVNVQQQSNVQTVNVQQQRKGPARNDNEVAVQRGPAKGEAQPATKMKAADKSSAAGAPAEDDEAEVRTVFGRRFRRVSNAWVDTAYRSSMSIRSVTRDTEEYRALVADEPAIDGFGKQLSGEVIVVWKGHAYRIN